MKIQRFLVAITFVNLGLLMFLLVQIRRVEAGSGVPVLRGSALEIVDDQGRVRASIKVQSVDPTVRMPDGQPYPETVILRLIDAQGRPYVKLAGSEEGSGLALLGETDQTHALLKAEGANSFLRLTNKDGRQQLVKP